MGLRDNVSVRILGFISFYDGMVGEMDEKSV